MDERHRHSLIQWSQLFRQKKVVVTLGLAMDTVHELLRDYYALDRFNQKRTDFMRDALHAIITSADDASADSLRDIALTALIADTRLADGQHIRLVDPEDARLLRKINQENKAKDKTR